MALNKIINTIKRDADKINDILRILLHNQWERRLDNVWQSSGNVLQITPKFTYSRRELGRKIDRSLILRYHIMVNSSRPRTNFLQLIWKTNSYFLLKSQRG